MRRREFIACVGAAAASAAWPHAASTQEPGRTYRLGFLIPVKRESAEVAAFFDELRLHGFVEGQNLVVIPGGFGYRSEQLAEMAAAVVKAAPDAIVSGPDLPTRALQKATRTVPLIAMTEDMVAAGLVASLARPGGNTTGISLLSPELDGKRQGLLMELVPGARRMAALADSKVTPPRHLQELQDAAHARGVELSVFGAADPEEIAPAIDAAKASGAEALNFLATPLFFVNSRIVIERAAALRLPAIYQWPEMAEAGGLVAYGPRITQLYRQKAQQVVKVLRGTSPADLPIEQPTTFALVINSKAAKALGLTLPPWLLAEADEVIE